MGSTRPGRSRAIALMVAVMFSCFLFVVGLAFLTSMERDSHLQLQADHTDRAGYLARAGLEYFHYKDRVDATAFPEGVPKRFNLGPQEFFEVTRSPTGVVFSRGWVVDSVGRVLAVRGLAMPAVPRGGQPLRVWDESLPQGL